MSVHRFKLLVLATLAGVLWAAAFPQRHWIWALPVAALLLVRLLQDVTPKSAFFFGLWAGFCHWLVAVSWVTEVMTRYGHLSGVLATLALAAMSTILGAFWGVAVAVASRAPRHLGWAVLALGLAAGEFVQGLPPFNFPWNPLASALVPWPWLLAPLPILGSTAFGLLVRLVLFSVGYAMTAKSPRTLLVALGGVALGGFFGVVAPGFPGDGSAFKVAAVQPNVPLEVRWDSENLALIESWVWDLSRRAANSGGRWVVWPESAIPRIVERDEGFREALVSFARGQKVWLTLNSIGFDGAGNYYNSMYGVSPEGALHRYDKVHLVPFGEYVPFFGRLAFFRPLVREVGGFTPGKDSGPIPGPGGLVGGSVCYEVAFPLHVASQVRQGAGVLVTVTNDGWYGRTAAPYQHLALAILRAVESRRFLVRAANTGVSAIIDPFGRLVQHLPLGQRGVIVGLVETSSAVTPASRFAFWLHSFAVVGFVVVILARVWASSVRRRGFQTPRGGHA